MVIAKAARRADARLEEVDSGMITPREGRVFVGVDGSMASLRALREGATQARRRGAPLHVVHVRRRDPSPPLLDFGLAGPAAWDNPEPRWADAIAERLIASCISDALGGPQAELEVRTTVLAGCPETDLAGLGSHDDDLLVVGTDGGRRWHHPGRRSVSRYCARHSRCPVLIVPGTELARATRHRPLSHRRTLPRDPWKEFDATGQREPHPAV